MSTCFGEVVFWAIGDYRLGRRHSFRRILRAELECGSLASIFGEILIETQLKKGSWNAEWKPERSAAFIGRRNKHPAVNYEGIKV
jgi:hypothetical protein